ncbi:MAG: hypothetical protein LVS60_17680 [Nodosilinea sp. LVE1205-7]
MTNRDRRGVFNDHTPANIDHRGVYNDHTGVYNDHTPANIDHRPVFRMRLMVIDMCIDKTLLFLGQIALKTVISDQWSVIRSPFSRLPHH